MRSHNSGLIITLSSIVGPLPDMRQCFYSGSKAMVEHYTSQLKNDLKNAGYNIAIANIHPGPVATNFEASATIGERFRESVPTDACRCKSVAHINARGSTCFRNR
jgi:short-subunit dehydrogenase